MIQQVLTGLANIQQAVDGNGEGLGPQVAKVVGDVGLPGSVTPNLNLLGRVYMIQHVLLKQGQTSIIMPNIPDYPALLVTFTARSDYAAAALAITIRFNGDAAANYNYLRYIMDTGATAPVAGAATASPQPVIMTANTAPANSFTRGFLVIPHPKDATYKVLLGLSATFYSTITSSFRVDLGVMQWQSTNKIETIQLYPGAASNFVAGTQFTLWGFK